MSIKFIPGKTVEVPEINFKDKIEMPFEDTALIIVDMQNDFVMKEGNLYVPSAQGTVENIKTLQENARKAGAKVVFTQDTQIEKDKEFDIWTAHCIENTWGWQIIDELKPKKDEIIIRKNRYDGFYGTLLEHYLSHVWQIKNVVIVGTVSNICVAHTAASAGLRWYYIVVPADGISSLTEFDQALTLRQVSTLYSGSVVKSVNDIIFVK